MAGAGQMSHKAAKDYYKILGADENASLQEIERRYRHLARQHHPDRGGNEEEMKEINEAYRVLRDAAARRLAVSPPQWVPPFDAAAQPLSTPPTPPDIVSAQLTRAAFYLGSGLMLLFLVRIYYIRCLWPLFVGALLLTVFGVLKVHAVLRLAREKFAPPHPVRRHVGAQEVVFWSIVCGGAYCLYLALRAI